MKQILDIGQNKAFVRISLWGLMSIAPWLASIAILKHLNEKKIINLNDKGLRDLKLITCPILYTSILTGMLTFSGLILLIPVPIYYGVAKPIIISFNGSMSFYAATLVAEDDFYRLLSDFINSYATPLMSVLAHITEGPTAKLMNGLAERNKEAIIIGSALVVAQILGYMAVQYAYSKEKEEFRNI